LIHFHYTDRQSSSYLFYWSVYDSLIVSITA
jgi:hypothetical protein